MAKVSVIIPTRNRAHMLSEAIDSVLSQTYGDFELVVVDDGSTDGTAEVVAAYQDSRIAYYRQVNRERGAARNRGVALSHGEYLTFLDDDDWFLPWKLESQVAVLDKQPAAGMVIGGWDRVNVGGEIVRAERPWLHHPRPELKDWLFAAMAHVAAVLIRREWFDSVSGFDETLEQAEDTHLWFKLAQAACPFVWLTQPVFRQRLHEANSVRNLAQARQGKLAMLDKVFSRAEVAVDLGMSRESAYARVYMGFACLAYAAGNTEEGSADLSQAVKLDPTLLDHDADRLLESVAAYAWSHLTGDPEAFTNRVFDNLPDELSGLQTLQQRALARSWMVGAFRAHQLRDHSKAKRNALRAVAADPRSILNRGLMSILAQSFLRVQRYPEPGACA